MIDGSKIELSHNGSSVVWHHPEWHAREVHLLHLPSRGGKVGIHSPDISCTRVYIVTDSQETIEELQHTAPGPGQWLARLIIKRSQMLASRVIDTGIHCIQGHMEMNENEKVDKAAKAVTEN